MIQRTLQPLLRKAAREYPIVTLTGPRQSGKTTLARAAFARYAYASLEDPDQQQFALEDPRGFLDQFRGRTILDEVQRAPELFSYLQTRVDEKKVAGQFILTGSQNFLLHQAISQSLAGRAAIFHLLPFSLAEMQGRRHFPVRKIGRAIPRSRAAEPTSDVMETMLKGFYPRIHDKGLDAPGWLRNYTQTYIERDVRGIVNVGDLEAFGRFLRLCAGRSGQLLNLQSLASDCGITHTTARRWLSVLEASFVVFLLRPHRENFSKRLIKSPKLYFFDSGLLCYLLRIRTPEDLRLHASRGSIFEGFVIAELMKQYYHLGREPDLFFWRSSGGHEVDLIIDHGSDLVPVEIKSGQTVARDFFKGLDYWRELTGVADGPAALFHGGNQSSRRRGIQVYSWNCL